MIDANLPSPGIGGKGHHLRRIAAQAISQVDVYSAGYGGRHPDATQLTVFFNACLSAVAAFLPIVPTATFSPASKSYSIAAGATAGPALTSQSGGIPVYSSSDLTKATVNSSTGAVTGVATGTATITATIPANGGYLAATATYVATVAA